MSKTLDDMLRNVWRWRDALAKDLTGLSLRERRAFWKNAIDAAGATLGHPLRLPRRTTRLRRTRKSSAR